MQINFHILKTDHFLQMYIIMLGILKGMNITFKYFVDMFRI